MDGSTPPAGRASAGRATALTLLLVLAALVPTWGTWDAPPLAEDASILGYVHTHALGSDLGGPQFGLSTLRFWRPVVTAAWDLQESLGIHPAWLRSLNLLAHVLTVLLLARLARQLGLGDAGALAAGLVAATFPGQGGVVTWLAGRTDGLVAPLLLLATSLALAGRRVGAVLAAALACATKETAFVLPAWVALLSLARSPGRARFLEETVPVAATCAALLVLRRVLIGAWIGGYPSSGETPLGPVLLGALSCLAASSSALLAAIAVGAVAVLAPGAPRGPLVRLLLAGLLVALVTALPLLGLLGDGVLEPQNLRTLRAWDLALGLSLAAVVGHAAHRASRGAWAVVLPVTLAVLGLRGRDAWRDARGWDRSAREAARWEADVRAREERLGPGAAPVLIPGVPRLLGPAYHLGFGVADRFRPPFPPAPRPVWPLRTVFEGRTELEPARGLEQGLLTPEGEPLVAELLVRLRGADGRPRETLLLDEAAAEDPDRTTRIELVAPPEGALLAVCLYTEIGYHAVPLSGPSTTLRGIVLASDGALSVGDAWYLAADVGAGTLAYLELRAHDPRDGRLLAASAWLPVVWEEGLVSRLPDPYAALRR